MLNLSPAQLVQAVIIIVISLTVHEFGHSLAALRLGDDTPRREGRLTLNPVAHIDLVGFVLLLVAGFGWAKPVRINTAALKKPVRDEILISLAGPAANVLLALLCGLLAWAVVALSPRIPLGVAQGIFDVLTQAAAMTVGLALFNLLPIPPLDGSHLITTWLVKVNVTVAATYFRYGSWALLALILFERISRITILPLGEATVAVVRAFYRLIGIIG